MYYDIEYKLNKTYSELSRPVTVDVAATYLIRCLSQGVVPNNKEEYRFPYGRRFFLKEGVYLCTNYLVVNQ